MEAARKRFYTAGYIVCVIAITAVVLWLLSHITSTVAILVGSIFLAYLLLPAVRFFEEPVVMIIPTYISIWGWRIKFGKREKRVKLKRGKWSRMTSVITVYVILFLLFVLILSFVVPNVTNEFNKFIENFPVISQKAQAKLKEFSDWLIPRLPEKSRDIIPRTVNKFTAEIEKYIYSAAQYTFTVAQKVLSTALAILIIPIFTFYILMDLENFKNAFHMVIPDNRKEEIIGLMSAIDRMLGRYIRGQIVVSMFIAFSITIALVILGIDYAFLIGLLSGIVNFIPYLGVIISLIPALILAFIYKGFYWAFLVFIVLEAIHQLEGQVVSPAIMGEAVGLPPLVVILALIIGGQALGLLGMLIAIPIAAAIRVVFLYYLDRDKLEEEGKDLKEKDMLGPDEKESEKDEQQAKDEAAADENRKQNKSEPEEDDEKEVRDLEKKQGAENAEKDAPPGEDD